MHEEVLVLGDQVLVLLLVEVRDHQALLALGVLAEAHRAGDFRQHARVLRRARLEELGHARQAARDVARLRHFLRDAREHFAHLHLLAVAHRDHRAHREVDVDRVVGAGDAHFLARLVDELDRGTLALPGGRGAPLGVDHHEGRKAGDVVDLLGDGDARRARSFTVPAYSVMIGRWCGSQVASCLPARTVSPSATESSAPYGTLWRSRSRPLSSVMITSPERLITTLSPLAFAT